jgi:hypothetical protein
MPVSTGLPPRAIGKVRGCNKPLAKIKAPFRLTTMNHSSTSWIWVWSRRGGRWVIDQEMCSTRLELTETNAK